MFSLKKASDRLAIALYARQSIEKENSISCETQLEYCKSRLMPDEREINTIPFVDEGCSGGNTNREAFQRMMRMVEKGKITKIVIYRLDRISRSLSDFVGILNTLKEHNVALVSTQEAFDTSSPYGDMIVKILMVFAEFERNSIIARVTQAYEYRSQLGFYMGGKTPYGFGLEDIKINGINTKRFSPIVDEIEQVKYIFENYAVENVTLGRLQKNLIENKIMPRDGGSWSTSKLSTILKNPVYVKADNNIYEYFALKNTNIISQPEAFDGIHGIQLYGKTKHKPESMDWSDIKAIVMTHEGVIDSDIWIKCQNKLQKNKQIRNAVSNKASWLGGKVICSQCGRRMTTIKGKIGSGETRIYFTCTGKSHNKICTGTRTTIYAENLEDMVYRAISERLVSLKEFRAKTNSIANPMINELRNKIKTLELEEEKITEAVTKSEVNSDLLALLSSKASKLQSDKLEINLKIQELQSKEVDNKTVINLSKKWKNANFEEKRGVCSILVDRILIDHSGNVEIVWNI